MTDEPAELALLTALTSDFLSQMMIVEALNEMIDDNWKTSLRSALSVWKELLWMAVAACYLWTRSSWLRKTQTGTAVLDSNNL